MTADTIDTTDNAASPNQKIVLISEGSGDLLKQHLAQLDLPKRALSLPISPESPGDFPSFVELWGKAHRLRAAALDWPHPARAWLVREIVPMAYERTWLSGEASPGIRFLSTVHRREGLTRDAFETHWRGPHTDVAKSYTVPVWNYVQNVVIEALGHASAEDGFVGMHFRNAEEMERRWQAYPSEAARGAHDAAQFMDMTQSLSMTAIETVWDDESP